MREILRMLIFMWENYLWLEQINVHLFVDFRIIISYMWPCHVFLFFDADISPARDNRKTLLIFLLYTEIIFRSGAHTNRKMMLLHCCRYRGGSFVAFVLLSCNQTQRSHRNSIEEISSKSNTIDFYFELP